MQIQTSLDWETVGTELTIQLNKLPYNPDLRKLIHNIDIMIVELSKAEVEARRIHKPEYTKKRLMLLIKLSTILKSSYLLLS